MRLYANIKVMNTGEVPNTTAVPVDSSGGSITIAVPPNCIRLELSSRELLEFLHRAQPTFSASITFGEHIV
jgi:hypothetical protein